MIKSDSQMLSQTPEGLRLPGEDTRRAVRHVKFPGVPHNPPLFICRGSLVIYALAFAHSSLSDSLEGKNNNISIFILVHVCFSKRCVA